MLFSGLGALVLGTIAMTAALAIVDGRTKQVLGRLVGIVAICIALYRPADKLGTTPVDGLTLLAAIAGGALLAVGVVAIDWKKERAAEISFRLFSVQLLVFFTLLTVGWVFDTRFSPTITSNRGFLLSLAAGAVLPALWAQRAIPASSLVKAADAILNLLPHHHRGRVDIDPAN